MIETGARVRIVATDVAAAGHLGTVVLATVTGDGYLVETDEPFLFALGLTARRTASVARRRAWWAANELEVVGGEVGPPARRPAVRREPPHDLWAARQAHRPTVGPRLLDVLAGRGTEATAPGVTEGDR